ncbi:MULTISPECIES: hypothetical protein [Eggerthella]|uniref:hypothetical protein n=1 Tax=Eggerthella TaxID=84111 RepID=UPI000E512D92|nr:MULTISPECIES: hypothetical protein [Eggerthella]RHO35638.1 hypothetical protein DW178_10755 [Eggerthella sp. AM16-19]
MKNNPIDKIRDLLAEPAARRKAVICAGVVAVLAIGGAGIAIASNRPEPIDSSPSAVEKTETDGDKASGAESVAPADIAKICPTLTLDGQDVGAPADELTVTTGQGRVLVTQRAGDDAAATVDSTARRSAALARSLDGCETGGKTVETVTWAAIDEGGNVEVAVTNSPATAPSGGTTADIVNGSGGHVISDDVWNSDGVHDSGYEQNAGTVTDSAGGKIEAGGKTDAAKADEGDKADTGKADDSGGKADSKKNDSKGGAASQASGGTSGSSASGSSPAQSQKKWVPEQGHWETDYGQVWVPNVVYVRHERYWVVTPNGNVGPFDSKSAANTWVYNDMVSGGKGGSLLDDSYTTSEDQGHYEQQATGKHWVVDVAGHWE